MSEWTEKFKRPEWQRKRLEIMNRDGFQCVCCKHNDGMRLSVHHLYYLPEDLDNPWDYPDTLLVTLCEECHTNAHEHPIFVPGSLKDMLHLGIFSIGRFESEWDRMIDMCGNKLSESWGALV